MSINLSKNNKVLVLIYADVEAYPPTLNLINLLSDIVKRIDVIERSMLGKKNIFNKNVYIHSSGNKFSRKDQMEGNSMLKLYIYLLFFIKTLKLLISQKPNVVIVYDPIPLVIYRLARFFSNKNHIVWYHNHDVMESTKNKFSMSYWVSKFEKTSFSIIDVFTLPSIERKVYFPLNILKGKFFFLPNYPSKKIYENFFKIRENLNSNVFNIVFQGSIGEGHGIEEVINVLGYNSDINKTVCLNLKGIISEEYKNELLKIAVYCNKLEFIKFHGFTSYKDVPSLASKCHLGIAIFKKTDIMNLTLGSSSNKIYEYAAVGMPIIFYNTPHFNKYLSHFKWAFPTNLSQDSILDILLRVNREFEILSKNAYECFLESYNYENNFEKIIKFEDKQ
jgi:hypothetical protein